MAYLAKHVPDSDGEFGLTVMTEYINPETGERMYTASTLEQPPPGFVPVRDYELLRALTDPLPTSPKPIPVNEKAKSQPADNTGLLLLALGVLALYA
jgi:hypothetical protein